MKIVINPAFQSLSDFINTIPDIFEIEGKLIYQGRNILKQYTIGEYSLVVKRFKRPHIINKIVYSFFRKSKAYRSFEYACQLNNLRVETPTPIACIENYNYGIISYSYYVCLESHSQTLRTLYDVSFDDKEEILKAYAQFAANLHQKNIYHKDFTQGNILFEKTNDQINFSLVDINRMSFNMVSKKLAYKNFWALWEQEESIIYIAKWYAYYRGFDETEAINKILYYNRLFNLRKKSKLAYFFAILFPKSLQS